MSEHRGGDVTEAVISRLESASFVVGDGEAPDAGGWQGAPAASNFVPYVDVHPTPGGETDGTITSPNSDASPDYQLISVGATRGQAEHMGDEVREVMLSAPFTLPGDRAAIHVRLDMLGGAIRDDTVRPAVWIVSDRYRILTVPG